MIKLSNTIRWPVAVSALLLGLLANASLRAAGAADLNGPSVSIPASDPHLVYEGRFDTSRPEAPVVIWQGSRIRCDFEGDALSLRFDDVKGQVFFNVEIDGQSRVLGLREADPSTPATFSGLGAGHHSLVVFKRTEAAAGTARFRGVALASGGKALSASTPNYRTAFLFIGDSITAGACNEDGAKDQWEDRSTHNNALSYGGMTAAEFQADYRNIAVSGMGIATGWVPMKAGDIWDRVYPRTDSARADLTGWAPNIVFVNLGENDDSFTTAKNLPFPAADYTSGYIALVQSIRQNYPSAKIVILRGGMFGGAQSPRLRAPWEEAVKTLEAADAHVKHFVFNHWSPQHPRVADHRAMADELIAWLRQQPIVPAK